MDSTPINKIINKYKRSDKRSDKRSEDSDEDSDEDNEDKQNDKPDTDKRNGDKQKSRFINKLTDLRNIKTYMMTIIITVIAHILLTSRIVVNTVRQIGHGTFTDDSGHYNIKGKILEGTIATIIGLLVSLINK
jgi:hypothetical protein